MKRKSMLKTLVMSTFVAAIALGGFVTTVQASIVIQPVDSTWTTLEGTGFTEWAENSYSGAGLLDGGAAIVETGDLLPDLWPLHTAGGNGVDADGRTLPPAANVNARGRFSVKVQADFDLGGLYEVEGFALWNYAERHNGTWYNDRGFGQADLEYSADGGATWLPLETMNFAQTADETAFGPEVLMFTGGAVEATHIRFNNATSLGSVHNGISEIRFIAIPEPATMVLLGLGSLLLRKKRS